MAKSLTLVATALNEKELIEEFVLKSVKDLTAVSDDFEIVIVDDGSTDGTSEILDRLARDEPRLKVIHSRVNLGTGKNYIPAYRAATKDIIFNNTVDMFFDSADLPKLLPLLEGCDVLSCYRTDLKANTLYQKILTLVNKNLIAILYGMGLQAYQTLQFHRRDFLQGIEIEATSSFTSPEILYKAKCMGLVIREAPITFHPRTKGTAKGGKLSSVLRSLRDVVGLWFRWRVLRRPFKTASSVAKLVGASTTPPGRVV